MTIVRFCGRFPTLGGVGLIAEFLKIAYITPIHLIRIGEYDVILIKESI